MDYAQIKKGLKNKYSLIVGWYLDLSYSFILYLEISILKKTFSNITEVVIEE